jgi:hypothetical protein
MSDFTKFKGNKSFNDSRLLESIGHNIAMFFDWGFLNIGAINSTKISNSDIRGSDKSVLKCFNDSNFASNNFISSSGLYSFLTKSTLNLVSNLV